MRLLASIGLLLFIVGCEDEEQRFLSDHCGWIAAAEDYGDVSLNTVYDGKKECIIEMGKFSTGVYHRFTAKSDTFDDACLKAMELFFEENRH